MMIKKSEKVALVKKPSISMFAKLNKDILPEEVRPLGESKRSTDGLTSDPNLMALVMPGIIGVSPESNNVNWQERLFEHFAAMTIYVKDQMDLEVGHQYDIQDASREVHIAKLVKDTSNKEGKVTINTSEQLADYVEANIQYTRRYLYGAPINPEQYLNYRVALLHPHVANKISEVDKSPKIRFYLYTDAEVLKAKESRAARRREIIGYQARLMEDTSKLTTFLWAYSYYKPIQGINSMSDLDKDERLADIIASDEAGFLKVVKGKHTSTIANLQQYIAYGILYKVPSTDTITDGDDKTHMIGETLDACIVYFANPENKSRLTEYEHKYKSKINVK